MPKILVIYEEVPENTFIAALDVTPEEMERYKTCAGKLVNYEYPIDGIEKGSAGFKGYRQLSEDECKINLALAVLVKANQRDHDDTTGGVFDAIIFTGFGL